ncbi:MAG: hypothetical protein ACLGI5_20160 [Thermoleophilia bacterium]
MPKRSRSTAGGAGRALGGVVTVVGGVVVMVVGGPVAVGMVVVAGGLGVRFGETQALGRRPPGVWHRIVTFGDAGARIFRYTTMPTVPGLVMRTSSRARRRSRARETSDVSEYDETVRRTLRVLGLNAQPDPLQLTRIFDPA